MDVLQKRNFFNCHEATVAVRSDMITMSGVMQQGLSRRKFLQGRISYRGIW